MHNQFHMGKAALSLLLVVSLVCSFALSAFAVSDYTVSGVWVLNSSISFASSGNTFTQKINFTSGGASWNELGVFTGAVRIYNFSSSYVISNSSGSVSSSYRTLDFGSSPQSVSADFYAWLTTNATLETPAVLTTIVTIDDQQYPFSGTSDSYPLITLKVTDTGAVIYSDDTSYTYTYSGNGTFLGLSDFAGSSTPSLLIGVETHLTPNAAWDYFSAVSLDDAYFLSIGITDSKVISVSDPFQYSSPDSFDVAVTVTPTGLTLFNGSVKPVGYDYTVTFTAAGSDFYGVMTSDGTTYTPGESFSLGAGTSNDTSALLSIVYQSEVVDPDPTPTEYKTLIQFMTDANTIVGQYQFTSSSVCPVVDITVTSTGATLTDGSRISTFTYSGHISGFANNASASSADYLVGSVVSFGGSAENLTIRLYIVGFSGGEVTPPAGTYSTTINIFDTTGQNLLFTYTDSAAAKCPLVTVTVLERGCSFSGSSLSTFPYNGDFVGFSASANSSDLVLAVGDVWSVGGYESDYTYSMYIAVVPEETLTWVQTIWKAVSSLPKKIADFLTPAWITNIFDIFDFSFVSDFFSEAYDMAKNGFYFKEIFEGESSTYSDGADACHPFQWLRGD